MEVTILTSKGNQDGTVFVKLAKGADRIELIWLEGKILDISERSDKAEVIPEERFILKNMLEESQKQTACLMTMIDRMDEKEDVGEEDTFREGEGHDQTFAERTQEILDNPSDIVKHLNGVEK